MTKLSYTTFGIIDNDTAPSYEGLVFRNGSPTMCSYGKQYVPASIPRFVGVSTEDQKGFGAVMRLLDGCRRSDGSFEDTQYDDEGGIRSEFAMAFAGTPGHRDIVMDCIRALLEARRLVAQAAMLAHVEERVDPLRKWRDGAGARKEPAQAFLRQEKQHLLLQGYVAVEQQLVALGNMILFRLNTNHGYVGREGKLFTYLRSKSKASFSNQAD